MSLHADKVREALTGNGFLREQIIEVLKALGVRTMILVDPINAAPQVPTASRAAAPSQEDVAQGEVAGAAPTPETDAIIQRAAAACKFLQSDEAILTKFVAQMREEFSRIERERDVARQQQTFFQNLAKTNLGDAEYAETQAKEFKRIGQGMAERDADIASLRGLYEELLYAVGKKHPGETRHQTALRYIQLAEKPRAVAAQSARPNAKADTQPSGGHDQAQG